MSPSARSAPSVGSTSGRFDDYPHPVLANCDDSESKDAWVAAGWGEREVPRERSTTWFSTPRRPRTSPTSRSSRTGSPRCASGCDGVDARYRRPAARRSGRPAPGRADQRAVAGLADEPLRAFNAGSHGRSIQLTQAQPGTRRRAGERLSPREKVESAALWVPRCQTPSPSSGVEAVAEDRVEEEEADEDPVGDEQRPLAPGAGLERLLQPAHPRHRLLEGLAEHQLADVVELLRLEADGGADGSGGFPRPNHVAAEQAGDAGPPERVSGPLGLATAELGEAVALEVGERLLAADGRCGRTGRGGETGLAGACRDQVDWMAIAGAQEASSFSAGMSRRRLANAIPPSSRGSQKRMTR